MRLKILSLFVAIQALSFGFWQHYAAEPVQASLLEAGHVHPAPKPVAEEFSNFSPEIPGLRFSARNMDDQEGLLHPIKQDQIKSALKKLPASHAETVKTIILDYKAEAHRGLGGNSMIILRGVDMSAEETVAVLVHEVAHNVDYAYLTPTESKVESSFRDGGTPLYESDPSLEFYRISWQADQKRKKTATNMDFVSGYAMADPFEDFAESYIFYILHNRDFRVLASSSDALYAKYLFMKHQVFGGLEFDSGDGQIDPKKRPWDITVMSYDLDEFLS